MNKLGNVLLVIFLVGCGGDSNTDNSDITGSWVTISCEQLTDSDRQPVDAWGVSVYTFEASGDIFSEPRGYSVQIALICYL